MAEETVVAQPATITTTSVPAVPESKPFSLNDIKVESNYAPIERKSVEMSTTEPKEPLPDLKEFEASNNLETSIEPVKVDTSVEDTQNALARERFADKLRAENAEAELAKLRPVHEIPKDAPDINDQSTWGKKYANEPNNLETFLKARDDWSENRGRNSYSQEQAQVAEQRRNQAIRADIARKEQLTIAKHPDYYDAIAPVAPIIARMPILKQYIAEMEMGTDIAYHLARNPASLQQLQTMTPFQAGKFLFALEDRLKAPTTKITNAPEPIKPIGSREVSRPNMATMAAKDINGFIALRNKQELAKKRAH